MPKVDRGFKFEHNARMAGAHQDLIRRLKSRIREFEDRKISGADLAREIYYVAREIIDEDESGLRRALEWRGNRIAVLTERGSAVQMHAQILEIVDDVQADLIDAGYAKA